MGTNLGAVHDHVDCHGHGNHTDIFILTFRWYHDGNDGNDIVLIITMITKMTILQWWQRRSYSMRTIMISDIRDIFSLLRSRPTSNTYIATSLNIYVSTIPDDLEVFKASREGGYCHVHTKKSWMLDRYQRYVLYDKFSSQFRSIGGYILLQRTCPPPHMAMWGWNLRVYPVQCACQNIGLF